MEIKNFTLTAEKKFAVDNTKKIAYNRLDHNGYRWYNTWFPVNGADGDKNIIAEMDAISDYMANIMLPGGLKDIRKLTDELAVDELGDGEYNLFAEGEYCNFWIRLINRPKDYNMYIHCYRR